MCRRAEKKEKKKKSKEKRGGVDWFVFLMAYQDITDISHIPNVAQFQEKIKLK